MKFTFEQEGAPRVEITFINHANLSLTLEAFESFLKAAGFNFDGHVSIEGGKVAMRDSIINDLQKRLADMEKAYANEFYGHELCKREKAQLKKDKPEWG